MQEAIWEYVCRESSLTNNEKKASFLKNLQPVARKLRSGYNPANVDVSYSDEDIVTCYMLRYFSSYSQLLPEVLQESDISFSKKRKLEVSFFGAGAAPECFGLAKFLGENTEVENLACNFYDNDLDGWMSARDFTTNELIPTFSEDWFPPFSVDIKSENLIDLSTTIPSEKLSNISNSDLVIFQNCINEIKGEILENMVSILSALKQGALMIVIDRNAYDQNNNTLDGLNDRIESEDLGSVLFDDNLSFDCRELNGQMPASEG
jgi:hypothetical protein